MRYSLLLLILLYFLPLQSQRWYPAKWITIESEKQSGYVELPFNFWKKPSHIKLKTTKEGKTFEGDNVFTLYLLNGDTLLKSVYLEGRYQLLQTIIKGDTALYRAVKAREDNYILYRNGAYERIDRYNVKENMFDVFDENHPSFDSRVLLYYKAEIFTILRQLNNEKKEKAPVELSMYNWRYMIGFAKVNNLNNDFFDDFESYKRKNFRIGIEKNFKSSLPFLYLTLDFLYANLNKNDSYYYYVNYKREVKFSYYNFYVGAKFELLGRKKFSPFFSGGYVYSVRNKYRRVLNASQNNSSLYGLPARQEVNAPVADKGAAFINAGLRFNLSTKIRVCLFAQLDFLSEELDLETENLGGFLFDLENTFKVIPDERQIGLIISRAF